MSAIAHPVTWHHIPGNLNNPRLFFAVKKAAFKIIVLTLKYDLMQAKQFNI